MTKTNDFAGQNDATEHSHGSGVESGHKPRRKEVPSTLLNAGYARVSLADGTQNASRQVTELEAAGCTRVWVDEVSGLKATKPQLDSLMEHLRAGDTVTVTELSRLGRDVRGVLALVDELDERKISLCVLNLGLVTSTPTGKLLLTILAAVSRLEVDLLRERTKSGIAQARRNGKRLGRPPALTAAQVKEAKRMTQTLSAREIGEILGCSERTIRRALEPRI